MRPLHFIAAVVLMTCTAVFAGTKPVVSEREVQAQIANLEHADAAVREVATAALVEIGPDVVAPLTKAMAQIQSPEFQARARQILLLCKRGGEVVDGLQLTLTADGELFTVGDPVTLTTTIKNTTAKDVNLCVGVSYSGVAFETGSALAVTDVHGIPLASHYIVGFCGTDAYGLNVTIPANSSVSYRCPVTLRQWPELMHHENRVTHVLSPRPGHQIIGIRDGAMVVRVRMSYGITAPGDRLPAWAPDRAKPANPAARYWSGKIHSNELQLSVSRVKCG